MNELTTIQYAWIIYFAGSLGCTVAAWWMFLWAWRFVRYAAVVTVVTILFTPYAIDPKTMMMAPAIYTLVFEGISQGKAVIMPVIKLMVGIWLIGIILVAVFVALTRRQTYKNFQSNDPAPPVKGKSRRLEHHAGRRHENPVRRRGLNRDEHEAREALLRGELPRGEVLGGEIPMRALRD
ncbi:MAG: hypothetical protein EOO52_11575 [Gammaproteobacteria bacterium]|nr:MAG: hypothetical protein EOO52_11575 [Gammaproteobacteria bacterium]